MCRGSVEECSQAYAGTCPQNQAQGRQAHDRRAEVALAGCLCVLESSVCVLKANKPPVTQAQIWLQTITIVPDWKSVLLAVADVGTTVCVIAAVEAAGAVIDAADMIDMGCIITLCHTTCVTLCIKPT